MAQYMVHLGIRSMGLLNNYICTSSHYFVGVFYECSIVTLNSLHPCHFLSTCPITLWERGIKVSNYNWICLSLSLVLSVFCFTYSAAPLFHAYTFRMAMPSWKTELSPPLHNILLCFWYFPLPHFSWAVVKLPKVHLAFTGTTPARRRKGITQPPGRGRCPMPHTLSTEPPGEGRPLLS